MDLACFVAPKQYTFRDLLTHQYFWLPCVLAYAFIVLGHYWQDTIQEPMKATWLTVPSFNIDAWSGTHFAFFAFMGYHFPGHFWHFFAIGVVWEMFEDWLCADTGTQLADCTRKHSHWWPSLWCKGIQDGYWYARFSDPLLNSLGYLTGMYLAGWRWAPVASPSI